MNGMDDHGQARRADPVTAKDAARLVRPGSMRRKLLEAHAEDGLGLTDEEAAEAAGIALTSEYATRCAELERAGLLFDTAVTRPGRSGMARMVRMITPLGRSALAGAGRLGDGMRPNGKPGRPDRYVDLSKSQAMSMDQSRRQAQVAEEREKRLTPRILPGQLRVRFGDNICRSCRGTGGNLIERCFRCNGVGIEP